MFRPQQQRPFNIPQQKNKPFMPQRELPNERVEQLFAVVMEGDINKINMTFSDKNTTANVINSEGQSPIHVILENNSSGLKENQKYDIIKLLINNGASVSAYDKQNVTPLHLACKFQYPKIVKLLIDNNAKINISDNLEMTPLHYALQGNVETCKERKKVRSLIPENITTIKNVSSRELRNLTIQIIEILTTDNFNRYLKHIQNIFKNIGDIYPFEFDKIGTQFMGEIGNILTDTTKNKTEQEQQIRDKIIGLTKSFNELMANKLKQTLKPISIGPQNADGWGPDNGLNKILPKETPEYNVANLVSNFIREADNLFRNNEKENAKLIENNLQIIFDGSDNIYTKIYQIIQINSNALMNSRNVNGFGIASNDLSKLILNADANPFNYQEIEINDVVTRADLLQPGYLISLTRRDPVLLYRGTTDQQTNWPDRPRKIKYNLSDDRGSLQALVGATLVGQPPNVTHPLYLIRQPGHPYVGLPYYYVSKFIFASKRIYAYISSLFNIMTTMESDFKTSDYFFMCWIYIPQSLLYCYDIAQNILFAEGQVKLITKTTQTMKETFQQNYGLHKNHPYSYLLENCISLSGEIITLIENISKEMKSLYVNCLKLIKFFNELIKLVNKKAGMEYLQKMLESNFVNPTITGYNNIFDRPLKSLVLPPNNFDEYYKIFGYKNRAETIKLFFENYAPYIDNKTYASYISLQASVNPRAGYLSMPITNSKGDNIKGLPNNVTLKNNGANLVNQNGIIIVDAANSRKLGYYGRKLRLANIDKSTADNISSIGEYFDEYLNNIKFLLIQKMIEIYNKADMQDHGIPLVNPTFYTKIDEIKQEYIGTIREHVNIDANSILFVTVGKIVDDLLILHIKKALYSNTNNYVKSFVDSRYKLNNDLIEFKKSISEIPFKSETGFSLNLKNLFDEIINNYIRAEPTGDYNLLMHTVDVMEDEEKIPEQFRIYNANYASISNIKEDQCYKIEIDVIKYLLNKQVDVNKKDYNGSSPIFYAIKNLHVKSIKELTKNPLTGVFTDSVKNNMGLTPYKYALSNYNHHIGSLIDNNTSVTQIIDRFTKPIYDQIKNNIESNPDSKNNVIRYLDIIFPQLIVMFNNLLYFYTKSYIGNWSRDNQNTLEQLLINSNLIINIDNQLPILEDLKDIVVKHSIKLDALDKNVQHKKSNVTDKDKEVFELQNSVINLEKEKSELNSRIRLLTVQRNAEPDQQRKVLLEQQIQYISTTINKIYKKQRILRRKINELQTKNNTIKKENNIVNTNIDIMGNNISDQLTNRTNIFIRSDKYLGTSTNVTDTYGQIFGYVSTLHNDIFNSVITDPTISNAFGYEDYFLYNDIWKQNLQNNNKMKSIFNIHLLTALRQKQLINKMENVTTKHDIDSINIDLNILNELYTKVFTPTVNNYFYLSQHYDVKENYILYENLEIITHIVKHVLCSNLYYAIVKVCTKYLLEITPKELILKDKTNPILQKFNDKENYNSFINEVISRIVNPNYNTAGTTEDAKLHYYILTKMPKLLVKLKTNIYENEMDADKSIQNIDILFNNIKNIIINNDVLVIPQSSELMTNLDNYIFKYYKDIFNQIIPQMKTVLDNYSRFILNESRFLEISKLLNDMAKNELPN